MRTDRQLAPDVLDEALDTHHDRSRVDIRSQRSGQQPDVGVEADEDPVDERWIGDDPPNHTIRAKRGMIC